MLGQVAQQRGHVVEGSAVDQVPAIALLRDQPGMRQLLEVKGQRRGGHVQLRAQVTRGEAPGAGHHQGAEHTQAHRLGQGGEGFDNVLLFHCSTIIELLNSCKWGRQVRGSP